MILSFALHKRPDARRGKELSQLEAQAKKGYELAFDVIAMLLANAVTIFAARASLHRACAALPWSIDQADLSGGFGPRRTCF